MKKSNQVRRDQLTEQEWQRMCLLFETIRRCRAKLYAKGGAA